MKNLTITKTGYGQWNAATTYYGKAISMHFTDSQLIDAMPKSNQKIIAKIVQNHKSKI